MNILTLKPIVVAGILTMELPIDAYSEDNAKRKAEFHRKGQAFLRSLAKKLELPAGSYDIRSNEGGIAVCGEVTLHSADIYIQIGQDQYGGRMLYRSCTSQKDYSGGTNHWLRMKAFTGSDGHEREVAQKRAIANIKSILVAEQQRKNLLVA